MLSRFTHAARLSARTSATARFNLAKPLSAQASAAGQAKKDRGVFFDTPEIRDGVAIIRFDGPHKMNTISFELQDEAKALWERHIAGRPEVKAVVFISAKPDNFIAGADINMIKTTKDYAALKRNILDGHKLFEGMKAEKKPIVAAINGSCLGGGLEWAMYCDYRIATTNKKTVLGLPEVKLGLLPGFGGTYHMPKLVGYQAALDIILTGKNVRPDKAKKLGLVDLTVDTPALENVAVDIAKQLANGSLKPKRKEKPLFSKLLEDTPLRTIMFNKAEEMVKKTTGGHYPAPLKILSLLRDNYGVSKQKHIEDEATKFTELAQTTQSEALIGLFDASTATKKSRFGKPAHKTEVIGVLGAGLMGAGIAQVSATKGFRVLMKDKDAAGVGRGEKYISDNLQKNVKKRRMTQFDFNSATSRVIGLHDDIPAWTKHFSHADMVIEAVFEELSVKHKVLQEIEKYTPAHCVFASNTSAIPIAEIAKGAKRPENVIGMHYFSPVPQMPLLEIITHPGTADHVAAAAVEVGNRQGKTCIVVKDYPGFYVNRCLGPMVVETYACIQDGVPLDQLDKAMKDFGFPVGGITLADEVGLDVAAHVFTYLSNADMGVRMSGGDISVIDKMVQNKWLGRKSGKGFYMYPSGKSKGPKQLNPEVAQLLKPYIRGDGKISKEVVQQRIMSRFVNEAVKSLEDGIIASPGDGDVGAVFGIGFPPFLGGPFRMLDIVGVKPFVEQMLRFRDQHGEQFQPCQLLLDHAKDGKRFHPKN